MERKEIEKTPLMELVDELRQVESEIMENMEYRNKIVMELWYRIPTLQESEYFRELVVKEKNKVKMINGVMFKGDK